MKTYVVKLKQAAVITGLAIGGIGSSGAFAPVSALTFNFNSLSGSIDPRAQAGFEAAGARWSSLFTDNVNIIIDIDFRALDPGVLAEADSNRQRYSYSEFSTALNADRTSADDNQAVSSLRSGPNFNALINRTSNNPNGSGSATPYVDNTGNNTSQVNISTANAKALGLIGGQSAGSSVHQTIVDGFVPSSLINPDFTLNSPPANATPGADATITFSSRFNFDFNPNDGIVFEQFDFVGVATHEIGHALGFTSGVDVLDGNSTPPRLFNDDQFTFVNSLDLFRYSADSTARNAIDWTADTRSKYFSLDGGRTNLGNLATGTNFGDRQQASHWKDNLGLGIMDPTFTNGELGVISQNDLRAFDVIGWNRASATATEVPEPSNIVGMLMFAGFGAKMVLKRRQKLAKLTAKSF
ncbi:NF038122 family metalloprotease [Chamaesiphon sp. VAR_48_metabat_403]|uniref:NF038122 family metalloprotease n=1 Tax=Chamaesiphon sp. VAR_48_metabat_403 TaxID=2964700 RepID=UPI00286DDDB4|nr:NF038122 family metalloprotease [Chamaesiphon sp. VAR_48_metabat_403]